MPRSATVLLQASLVLLALYGCALVNPYPQPKPTQAEKTANANDSAGAFTVLCEDATTATSGGDAAKLCEAFGYAERWRLRRLSSAASRHPPAP